MAPHSSTLAWKIPWTEEPESDTTERLHFHFSLSCIREANGNPLQCSCLENPRDGGTWWAAISGVAQSRTWLKWLSSSSSLYKAETDDYEHVEEGCDNCQRDISRFSPSLVWVLKQDCPEAFTCLLRLWIGLAVSHLGYHRSGVNIKELVGSFSRVPSHPSGRRAPLY